MRLYWRENAQPNTIPLTMKPKLTSKRNLTRRPTPRRFGRSNSARDLARTAGLEACWEASGLTESSEYLHCSANLHVGTQARIERQPELVLDPAVDRDAVALGRAHAHLRRLDLAAQHLRREPRALIPDRRRIGIEREQRSLSGEGLGEC